jgi:hypothetical protein
MCIHMHVMGACPFYECHTFDHFTLIFLLHRGNFSCWPLAYKLKEPLSGTLYQGLNVSSPLPSATVITYFPAIGLDTQPRPHYHDLPACMHLRQQRPP